MLSISVRFHLLTLLTNLTSVHSLQISTLPVLQAVYSVRITKQTVMMMMNYLGAVYVMATLYWDAMVVMMTCIVEDAISKTNKFSVLLLCIHQSFSLQSILWRLSEISSLCSTPLLTFCLAKQCLPRRVLSFYPGPDKSCGDVFPAHGCPSIKFFSLRIVLIVKKTWLECESMNW